MRDFSSIFTDLALNHVKAKLRPQHALVIAALGYYAYDVFNSIEQFEAEKKSLQIKNKDVYMATFQTYFIENFNSPFSVAVNYDEG